MNTTTAPPTGEIKFLSNWNNKLALNFFTTIRPEDPARYRTGDTLKIILQGRYCFDARIKGIRSLKLQDIGDITAYLDAGTSAAELREFMADVYKNIDFSSRNVSVLLMEKI